MAVNEKRIRKVMAAYHKKNAVSLESSAHIFSEILASIPEFQTPEWIKCSERMPELDQSMWWYSPLNGRRVYWGHYGGDGCLGKDAIWMPVTLPTPPVEEDSEFVKRLKEKKLSLANPFILLEDAIAILKEAESKK